MFGNKQAKIDELQALVDVYGNALEHHHDSKGSCEEATAALREKRDALKARVDELERKLSAVGHAAFRVPEVKP